MKKLLGFLLLMLVAGAAAAGVLYLRTTQPYRGFDGSEQFVEIPQGTGSLPIGDRLVSAGVVRDIATFRIALWLSGQGRHLKAGEYRFDRAMTPRQVVDKIARGDVFVVSVTFPEGQTIAEMAKIFEAHGLGTADSFVTAARDAAPIQAIDAAARDLEGYLFPETYALPRHTDAARLVRLMLARFDKVFTPELRQAAAARGLTVRQAVTLASIVEKETAKADERPMVAAVYTTRLRIGMALQCDPTVIYGLLKVGRYNGNLHKDDLSFDSPYNTYRYPGLPPGPIASPGRASLEAAVHPSNDDYVYFVSRNDGSHAFARTLEEHNRNVQKYQVQYSAIAASIISALALVGAQETPVARVRAWRAGHELQILRELFDLVAIPNVASDREGIARNAQALMRMFEKRRFLPETIPTSGSPVVLAERRVPGAARTLTFYFHYDGQPVDAREWTNGPPFAPIIVTGPGASAARLTLDKVQGAINPDWRVYGRSSSDDKSPIVAFLSAIEALDAANITLTSNIRVILEGDEEAGSPGLEAMARTHGDRIRGDAMLLVDGPRHASDRPTLSFGARGIMTAIITVYGPARDLHSGNYGNWGPNPALALARLLTSMKDENGRITVDGFYDEVTPLTAEELRAIDEIPDVAPTLMQAFGFSRPENTSERLERRHNLPTLNINALDAGGGVGGQGRTIIPATASAKLDLRMVKAIDPTRQFDRLVAHVRKQGFFIVDKEPDAAMRASHPWMAQVTRTGGYPAGRTPMELPLANAIAKALSSAAGGPIVRLPTIGGSAPFYVFTDVLNVPTFGLSIVNFDNNQHGANENLRIKNLWEGIDSMAALLTMGR